MKLKKYKMFIKFNENSFFDEFENLKLSLEFLFDNIRFYNYCDGYMVVVRVSNEEDMEVVRKEVEIYNLKYKVLSTNRIVIISDFMSEYDNLSLEDFVEDNLKNYRLRKEIDGHWFSCVYGSWVRDYEVWSDLHEDPISFETLEQANVEYLEWQYKIKNNIIEND